MSAYKGLPWEQKGGYKGSSGLITAEEGAFSKGLSETIICPSGNPVCPTRHLCGDLLRLAVVSVLKAFFSDHALFLPKVVKPQKNYVDLNSKFNDSPLIGTGATWRRFLYSCSTAFPSSDYK